MFSNILQGDAEAPGTNRFFKEANQFSFQSSMQNIVHYTLL